MSNSIPNSKCVIKDFGGKSHPHNYCIAPLDEIAPRIDDCDPWGTECIANYTGATLRYTTGLVLDGDKVISSECKEGDNVIGNKYVLETNTKCKLDDGRIVTRHRYIDNSPGVNIITGRKDKKGSGLIPSAFSSAMKAVPGKGFFDNTFGDSIPPCQQVRVKCHIMHKKNGRWKLDSGDIKDKVNIANNELENIAQGGNLVEGFDNIDGFKNLYEATHEYLDRNPNLKELFKNNTINEENCFTSDKNLMNIYYLLLTMLMFFILFKIVNKR
jgi:hypothetical protein